MKKKFEALEELVEKLKITPHELQCWFKELNDSGFFDNLEEESQENAENNVHRTWGVPVQLYEKDFIPTPLPIVYCKNGLNVSPDTKTTEIDIENGLNLNRKDEVWGLH